MKHLHVRGHEEFARGSGPVFGGRSRLLVALVASIAVGLAGCGDGGEDEGSSAEAAERRAALAESGEAGSAEGISASGEADDTGMVAVDLSGAPEAAGRAVSDRSAAAGGPAGPGSPGDPVDLSSISVHDLDLPPIEPSDLRPTIPEMDPADRVPQPEAVRGIYLNAWSAGSTRKMASLLELADRTEINSFVIDVKDVSGYVSYPSTIPLVGDIGADGETRIGDPRAMLERLKEHGVYPVARIVVFKDTLLARKRPDLAIQRDDGTVFEDHNGHIWINPYNRTVWDYAIGLAREAASLGFSEIQWDYVRFPDVPWRFMQHGVFPGRDERTREEAIREFLLYARAELADLEVPLTADVFGLTTSAGNDMGIGQRWASMTDATDVLLPMIYPSHYGAGSYGFERPNAHPYEIMKTALDFAVRRSEGVEGAAVIRPWIQDFSMGEPPYGPVEVRAQIEAVYDAGLNGWVLWNPGSNYTAEALASASGRTPGFQIPGRDFPVEDSLRFPEPIPGLIGEPVEVSRRGQ